MLINFELHVKGRGKLRKFERGREQKSLGSPVLQSVRDETGAELSGLLFHSTVLWLLRGKVLERVGTLKEETHAFLKEQNHELADRFRDDEWIAKLYF